MFRAYGKFWKNLFRFKGVASKGEFWWPVLIHMILVTVISVILSELAPSIPMSARRIILLPVLVVYLLLWIGTISCAVRRLREAGYPWSYLLFALVPVFGWIILCVYLGEAKGTNCRKGKKGHVWVWRKETCEDVCSYCGETKEHHSFEGCKCTACGKIQDKNHRFTNYIRKSCLEACEVCNATRPRHDWNHCTCAVCGKRRNEAHDFRRVEGRCIEKCSVCGKERDAHKFNANGVCTICGAQNPKPFTLDALTEEEIRSVRFACEILSKLDSFSSDTKKSFRNLSGSLTRAKKLDPAELAMVAVAVSQVSQALSSDKNTMDFSKNDLNVLMNRLHLVQLMSATQKIGDIMKNAQEAAKETQIIEFVKKPLAQFALYDESYQGYVKGGVCDVCNQPLEGKKAYAVDNKTFYDSPEYFDYLSRFQKSVFGLELSKADYEMRRKSDTSPGSAVCENCIHMFADVSTVVTEEQPASNEKKYYETDNLGSRHDTCERAMGYWLGERVKKAIKPPFTMYTMPSYESGESALLELPFFHKATDSGKIVCDRVMTFGVYETTENGKPTGKFEALVCGSDLTREEFNHAEAAFEKHGGQRKNNLEPGNDVRPVLAEEGDPNKVKFREQLEQNGASYVVHTAERKADALAFLKHQHVAKGSFYIVVDTPEGTLGRDIAGIYEE